MILNWLLTGVALLIAIAAMAKARRTTKRLERLTETYWELRYDHGQLRARVNKLDPETPAAQPDAPAKPAGPTFIPLSSLKR